MGTDGLTEFRAPNEWYYATVTKLREQFDDLNETGVLGNLDVGFLNSFFEDEKSLSSCREICLETSIQDAILCTVDHLNDTINPSDGVIEKNEDDINAEVKQNDSLNRSIQAARQLETDLRLCHDEGVKPLDYNAKK